MMKPALVHMNSRTNINAGVVVKVVSVISLGVILFTWLSINPRILQSYDYQNRRSVISGSILGNCDCETDNYRVVNGGFSSDVSVGSGEKNVSILLGVLTMASKVERRNLMRLAYGVQQRLSDIVADVTVRFVIGKPKNEGQRLSVALEVLQYGDMMILDCEENMNHGKSFTYFAMVAALGIHYDYVMKLDDDSYVRLSNLAKSLDPLPRMDLYYGFALPCEEQDPYRGHGYMAGMGYIISWDIVEWLYASPEVRNDTEGTEDKLMGRWLKAGDKGKNRVSVKPYFYDHPEFGGKCAHELIPETILIHQVKNDKRWFDVLSFFEGGRIGDAIAPAINTTSDTLSGDQSQ